jgi:hypothetical protein
VAFSLVKNREFARRRFARKGSEDMGLFDDFFDPDQFQDSGGLPGRLLSLHPELDPSQPSDGIDTQSPSDIGDRLSAGLQNWAQTPAGNPFAALANGITGFNGAQPANTADPSFIGPPPPVPAQTPDLGDRLGAAFQSWAHTQVGNPFAALANGITGFNTGQTSIAPVALSKTPAQAADNDDRSVAPVQTPQTPFPNVAPVMPSRRPSTLRR